MAQEDLVDIRDYYDEAGYRVARQMFVELVVTLFIWPMRDYLIHYKPGTSPLQIITNGRVP